MGIRSGKSFLLVVGVFFVGALFAVPALSAPVAYLQYGTLKNAATSGAYAGQIPVFEYSINVSNPFNMDSGGSILSGVKPHTGYIKLRVAPGSASNGLFIASWTGMLEPTVVLTLVNTDAAGQTTEITYTMTNAGVASLTTGVPGLGANDGMLLYLAMSRLMIDDPSAAQVGLPQRTGYDFEQGKRL